MTQVRNIGVNVFLNPSSYRAGANSVFNSTARMSQGFKSAISTSKLLDNQAKAIATTFRYALAGSLVFGITGAVSKLADFESELGTIDSLAGKMQNGNFKGLGDKLQDIGSDAIVMSNKFGIAVGDVEDYMARFYSTFDTGSRKDLDEFTQSIIDLQTALGSEAGDPGALASGIGGLINAIPKGRNNIGATSKQLANIFAYITQKTPNVTGTDIANAAGRFASITNTSGMSVAQIFSLFGQAAKAGGSPKTVVQGITQLLGASFLHPKTPANKAAYQAAGLPTDPTLLRNMGGMKVIEQLMNYIAPNGLKLTRQQRGVVNSADVTTNQGQLALAHALPGLNLTGLYNLFGRQQSVQQFINILSQGGVKGLEDFTKSTEKAANSNIAAQRAADALKYRGLQVLQTSMSNLSLSLVRGLTTPLTQLGKVVKVISDEAAKHRTTTTGVEVGAGSYAIARLLAGTGVGATVLGKLGFGGKVLGRFLGKGNLGKVAGTAIAAEESAAVLGGSIGADGSRANPFWVIISPLSWQFGTGSMSSPIPNPPGGCKTPPVIPVVGKNLLSKAKGAASLTGLVGAADIVAILSMSGSGSTARKKVNNDFFNRYRLDLSGGKTLGQAGLQGPAANAVVAAIQAAAKVGFTTTPSAITLTGAPTTTLKVALTDANGNVLKVVEKKGVPIAVTKDTAPQSQGKAKVRKGQ